MKAEKKDFHRSCIIDQRPFCQSSIWHFTHNEPHKSVRHFFHFAIFICDPLALEVTSWSKSYKNIFIIFVLIAAISTNQIIENLEIIESVIDFGYI